MSDERPGLLARFDALSQRERLLVALTLVALLLFAWWLLVYEAVVPQTRSLQQSSQRAEGELQALRAARDGIRRRLDQGVHREQRARVEALQQELARLRRQLEEGTEDLVSPQEMFALMRQMIDAAPKLRLLELRRSAVDPLFRSDNQDAAATGKTVEEDEARPTLYRHRMQVRLQGRYADILAWLQQLEGLPWQLMWNRVELKTGDYPQIEIALTLSTVSASRAWVGL